MNFYISLFVFIISVILGLALMIAGKDMRRDKFLLLTTIHAIFLFAFIASLLLQKNISTVVNNYFFTAFVCSGIIMSGLAWRSDCPKILRFYFSIFILTVPMFLISPSMLLNFLTTMNFSSTNGPIFHLKDRYFLETQNTSGKHDDLSHYKLIVKRGIFHQNVQRDISFGGRLDSVKVLEFDAGKSLLIRGYTSVSTHVSAEVDSEDVRILFHVNKPGDVEYHL